MSRPTLAFAAEWSRLRVRIRPASGTRWSGLFTQTLLSWNAAPPTGATASAPVSMLMPRPPIWALFGWTDSAISTPRRTPSNNLAISVVSPRMLPSVTASPSAISSGAASSGWIITLGAPSRACEDGVSLKVVLRKLREGLVASRNGCASSASSMMAQWSGSEGILSHVAHQPRRRTADCAQSALKWNFLSAWAKPSR